MTTFNWANPDYLPVWQERAERLAWLRQNPTQLPTIKAYYRENPWDFINDWGITVDPRNIEIGRADLMPFVLFPKQIEWLRWAMERWRGREGGITAKSRDMGLSWLAITLSCTLCTLHEGMNIGFGSRKEMLVDDPTPDSIFYKGRIFMQNLPREFQAGWSLKTSPFMRIEFPATRAVISGEAGDNIGRGGRKSIYFVDESAHIERQELIDAALGNNTNCRMDFSSVRGNASSFAQRWRQWPEHRRFLFHWRDNPLWDQDRYNRFAADWGPIITAQEVDISFDASVEGILIPAAWVSACVNAHLKMPHVDWGGINIVAYDVADQGQDKNGVANRNGMILTHAEEWSGVQSDLYASAEKAVLYCDVRGTDQLLYDGDGLGANVRGDVSNINKTRADNKIGVRIVTQAFRGSYQGDKLYRPDDYVRGSKQLKNKDFFENYKAQSWWDFRLRFENTVNALQGRAHIPNFFISLQDGYPHFSKLCIELSQPVYRQARSGRMMVDKAPDAHKESVAKSTRSPNLADSAMMSFAPRVMPILINDQLLR